MTNILHEIKRGFLILGITGPLRSGCTTAANFFSKDIADYIENNVDLILPKIDRRIPMMYERIAALKQSCPIDRPGEYELEDQGQDLAAKTKVEDKIAKEWALLKAYLDLRDTLSVLSDYKKNNFKYISMTDMLLKLTVESFWKDKRHLTPILERVKDAVDWKRIHKTRITKINHKIRNRGLTDLSRSDIETFEQYLIYVRSLNDQLKKEFKPSELGSLLQDLGDNARKCGNPIDYHTPFDNKNPKTLFILAEEANNVIKFYRARKSREKIGLPMINEFVIEAFRNPYEIEYFRNRYYEFYLLSIVATSDVRKTRKGWSPERDERDRGEHNDKDEFYRQNVSGCVHLSDIAINNNGLVMPFKRKLAKYLALIRRPGCIAPQEDEMFMHQAYSMSVKSICISRQVGAVVIGPNGYIVGAGWNDVSSGQIGCGYRRISDIKRMTNDVFHVCLGSEEEAFRDFIVGMGEKETHSFCYKDVYAAFKASVKAIKMHMNNGEVDKWGRKHNIRTEAIKDVTGILKKAMTQKKLEYCRALHAEENAILQTAKIGGAGIKGGTIYTTTFPCELCAKKIYQAGIKRVVYTEPYPESISEEVFFRDGKRTIELVQFEGVKSHSYYRLYKATIPKKEFQYQEKFQ